jgi:hypothetical protein
MTFDQLHKYVFEKMRRLPNGCCVWDGTLSSTGSPVVKIDQVQYSVKALLDELLHGPNEKPKRRFCATRHCAHPRHISRPNRSPVPV